LKGGSDGKQPRPIGECNDSASVQSARSGLQYTMKIGPWSAHRKDDMKRVEKRDIAIEMLDAAVSEHLDHGRHFAAYNLAAVAEELLSKFVQQAGFRDSSTVKIGAVKVMNKALGYPEGDDKALRKAFFETKNSIKHMDTNQETDRYITANIETGARRKIGDAVRNLEKLGWSKSPLLTRFAEHRKNAQRKLFSDSPAEK